MIGSQQMLISRKIYSFKVRWEYSFMRSWKNWKSPIFCGEKAEAVLLVSDIKTMVKWTLVIIYGRIYIAEYSQVKIIIKSQIRMLFNDVLEKYLHISLFPDQWRKKGWIQVLDWKWCLEVLFLFQFTVNCSYFVKLYTR